MTLTLKDTKLDTAQELFQKFVLDAIAGIGALPFLSKSRQDFNRGKIEGLQMANRNFERIKQIVEGEK
jgi:hypothetical protein